MPVVQSVPVLHVSDVSRSIDWYKGFLGFDADPFPSEPPYRFALLHNGRCEIMLQLGDKDVVGKKVSKAYQWDVYLRLESTPFREIFSLFQERGIVTRRLERMFYNLAEFEIKDPDGHIICLSQKLEDMSDLPAPEV